VIYNGWLTHYDVWTYHGERYSDSTDHVAVSDNIIHNDLCQLVCVAMGSHDQTGNDVNELNVIENPIDHSEDPEDPLILLKILKIQHLMNMMTHSLIV